MIFPVLLRFRPWGSRRIHAMLRLLPVLIAVPLAAQSEDDAALPAIPPPVWLGFDFADVRPRGPLAEGGDDAFGFQFQLRIHPARFAPLALRLDAGLITHSQDVRSVCLPDPIGCRVGTDVVTALEILYFGVGPEISGWKGRLYLFGMLGASRFETSSFLRGPPSEPILFSTLHLEDVVLSRRLGAGIRLPPARRATRWRVDLGIEYHLNGTAEYLRPDGVVDHPDGSITLHPDRTEANLVAIRLGVSLGLGGRRAPE